MTRRRQRVPGTPSTVFRVEVATGGRPLETYLAAVDALPVDRGQVWVTSVHHDDGCPALGTGPMAICTCEIVELVARRYA